MGVALPPQSGDATVGDPISIIPPSNADLRASPSASFAQVEVLRATVASMDDFKRETLETVRAELEVERASRQALQRKLDEADDAFDQKLQQKLLDVDLVLPSAASAMSVATKILRTDIYVCSIRRYFNLGARVVWPDVRLEQVAQLNTDSPNSLKRAGISICG
eukprot:SAG31_NODE_2212_length_6174_cov_11.856790_2_plen_164_part_00